MTQVDVTDDGLKFGRRHRLLQRQEFDRVFESPARIVVPPFTLLHRDNNLDYPRLGMVISKKNVRLAVARNNIRRRIRESFRASRNGLPGVDLVLLVRRDVAQFDAAKLSRQLTRLWRQLADG